MHTLPPPCCDCRDCPCTNSGKCACLAPASSSNAGNSGCLCVACAHTSELLLSVKGMTCASCVSTVKNALKSSDGVMDATVNLLGERALVRYHPHIIQPEQIATALNDIGFDAHPLSTSANTRKERQDSVHSDESGGAVSLAIFKLPPNVSPDQISLNGVHHWKLDAGRVFIEFSRDTTVAELKTQLPEGSQVLDVRPIEPLSGVSSSLNFTLRGSQEELRTALQTLSSTAVAGVLFTKTHAIVNYFPHVIGARAVVHAVSCVASFSAEEYEGNQTSVNFSRLALSIPLSCLIVLVVLVDAYRPLSSVLGLFILLPSATILQFYCGLRFHQAAINGVKTCHPTMDFLISASTTLGYVFGLLVVLLRSLGLVVRAGTMVGDLAHDMIMSAALITILLLGRSLEEYVKKKTTAATRSLRVEGNLATIIQESIEEKIHPCLLHIGDQVVLRPGECAPCDGVVLTGNCGCDEALLTGESIPVQKVIGDTVLEGSTIVEGYCILCVREVGSSTTLAQIRRLVEEAQLEPTKIQRLADTIASVFVPYVLVITVLTWITWAFIVGTGAVSIDTDADAFLFVMRFGLSVMLIACPCSFGLATPTAIMVATGVAAKFGCLVKSGRAFESVRLIEHVVLDKTGTITFGQPQVVEIRLVAEATLDRFKQVLAAAERFSEHPLGKSLAKLGDTELPVTNWVNVTGKGVNCGVDGMQVCVATLEPGSINTWSDAAVGATLVGLSVDGVLWGGVALRDGVKPEARALVKALQARNICVWMCTGDSSDAAHEVARAVNIAAEDVRAKVSPEGKSQLIASLKNVLMVGDGINDSIALAKADVGIAIGCGNHITMDSADVVLVKNNLNDLKAFFDLADATVWTIYRNFSWAFAFNIVGIPIAAGIGYPINLTIPPIVAGVAMACSSILVVSSSLFLSRFKA